MLLDRHLGVEKTCLSPATGRMIGTVGSMVSFQEGSQLLQELAGIVVDASSGGAWRRSAR
jgi:hypothetical protein